MAWPTVFALLIGFTLGLMMLGVPVAFVFFTTDVVGAAAFMGGFAGIEQVVRNSVQSVATFSLLPIPLFVLMGELFFHSGIVYSVFGAIDKCLGRIRARLSYLTIIGGAVFAALSGSSLANAAMLGSLMIPEMTSRGYKTSIALGPILGTGSLALLIPPSTLAVVLGSLGKIDIGALLLAGVIPGIILAVLYAVLLTLQVHLGGGAPPDDQVPRASAAERLRALLVELFPMTFIMFLVTGSIFLGIATPTEAAALGAAGVLGMAAVRRRLSREVLRKSFLGTAKVTVMTTFIITASSAFSQILAFSGASQGLIQWFLQWASSPLAAFGAMFAVLLILGMFMDQVSMMMLTVPVFIPIAKAVGADPVWFGILMLLGLEIGFTTPPFGLLLFVVRGVTPPDVTMQHITKAALPYIGCVFVLAALLAMFPELTLYLPHAAGLSGK